MGSTSDEDIYKIITEYHGMGGNFIDTANVYQYGQSEQKIACKIIFFIKGALEKSGINRDEMVIGNFNT
jgi:aryl-alcohol dehydrogenase-like predicted oxidoreductase